MLLTGDNGTLVTSGLTVGSDVSATQWQLNTSVALSPTAATGAGFIIPSVIDSTDYSITYTTSSTSNTITFNSGVSATTASILQGLKATVDASHPTLAATLNASNSLLSLQRVDEFSTVNFSVSIGIGISKISKIGEVQSTTAGPEEAEPNTLVKILTPLLGWDSVTNILAASPGSFRETDEALRERFRNTKFERASNILESIYSALINLSGVEEVKIYENDTDVTDGNGVPPHSFLTLIVGGTSLDIAETIWENKPLGIQAFGNTEITITDSQGFGHDIGFSRPDPVPIYIDLTLTTNSEFPSTGADDIKSALISYFEDNFNVGDSVIYSRLYTPINSISGHQVDSLTIGISPAPVGMSNVTIDFDQIASLSSANINITT
ncbi:Baseplate J-like protein [compost metagenome]